MGKVDVNLNVLLFTKSFDICYLSLCVELRSCNL